MKAVSPLLLALVLPVLPCFADDQIVVLGDSLSYAYESEFGFKQVISFQTFGEGAPVSVRNWIEVLSNPTYRGTRFDLGTRINLTVDPPDIGTTNSPFNFFLRQQGNFAIPGLKVDGMRQFVQGEKTFYQLMGADVLPQPTTTVGKLLSYSNYTESNFSRADFQAQVTSSAERLVISIGGNDVDDIYGTLYDGAAPGTFVSDFVTDMAAVIDSIQTLNPNIQIVLANVPHVGITLKVRGNYPYDPVKTERVSAVLRDLNGQLAVLAKNKNIGYADIYTPTVRLIDGSDLVIHGINYNNASTGADGTYANGPVWLNGQISSNFHPNTNGQTQIANAIVRAFNKRYNTGIPLLSATEILVGLCGKNATPTQNANAADMIFSLWMSRFGLTGLPTGDDTDGDGVTAWVEFGAGLNPTLKDADFLETSVSGGFLNLAYPVRLPNTTKVRIHPESSSNPGGPYTPFVTLPTQDPDGLYRAKIPVGASPGFLRVKAEVP